MKSNDANAPKSKQFLSPSEYMRKRRPHLFSDILASIESTLTKEVLSYHLSTITSRNGESTFEHFARKLAEAEICPNLLPNTGPTGGGDAKADTETYPVGEEVALRWYQGEQAAAQERWAFAISAKKAWQGKVRSDVASIAGTGRDYKKVFFITNQAARAKARAEIEDDLANKYGIPVRILDLNWILDKVFENGRISLAVNALGLSSEFERRTQAPGPKDFERAQDLLKLDAQIADASRYIGTPHLLAEDLLEGALTARGLGKPRSDVDGRFLAARRAAVQSNSRVLEYRVVYNWAWTVYFWFDDFVAMSSLYGEAADLISSNEDAEIVEKLSNLWSLLRGSVSAGKVPLAIAKLVERGEALRARLQAIANIDARPNNALHARSALLFVELIDRHHDKPADGFDDIWQRFKALIKESKGLGTFPFEPITDALAEFGSYVESAVYDDLVTEIADALAERRREGASAVINVQRAEQKLDHGKPYEAIRWFGRTIDGLVKKEYEFELFKALAGLAQAYDMAGLPWAARSSAMAVASHQFTQNLKASGTVTGVSTAMLKALFTFEVQIGRVPQAVAFHRLEMTVRTAKADDEEGRKAIEPYRFANAMLMSALVLNTPRSAIKELERLPDSFHQLDLTEAAFPTLFVLGQWEAIRREGWIPESASEGEVEAMMVDIRSQGGAVRVGKTAFLNAGDRCKLSCRVIGAELTFDTSSVMTSVSIAEALLGIIESFVATSLNSRVFPVRERLEIRVDSDMTHVGQPVLSFIEENGITVGRIVHEPNFGTSSRESHFAFRDFCRGAIAELLARLVVMSEEDGHLAKLEKENVFGRALLFSNVPMMTENIFGEFSALRISDYDQPEFATYPNLRTEPWSPPTSQRAPKRAKYGEGDPPAEMIDEESKSHRDYTVMSPIDIPQWDTAKWNGSVFVTAPPEYNMDPILGISYANEQAAVAIFDGLRSRYGEMDGKGAVRVVIIRGISKKNPNAYTVSIGPNLDLREEESETMFGYVARFNRMYPQTSKNLDVFLTEYYRRGKAELGAFYRPDDFTAPKQVGGRLKLREIVVREAWQIGENDPDISCMDAGDEPYIPEGIKEPPILKALARLKRFREKGKSA